MSDERGEKVDRPTLKVGAEVGKDRAEKIKKEEAATGTEARKDTGRVTTDVEKGAGE